MKNARRGAGAFRFSRSISRCKEGSFRTGGSTHKYASAGEKLNVYSLRCLSSALIAQNGAGMPLRRSTETA